MAVTCKHNRRLYCYCSTASTYTPVYKIHYVILKRDNKYCFGYIRQPNKQQVYVCLSVSERATDRATDRPNDGVSEQMGL